MAGGENVGGAGASGVRSNPVRVCFDRHDPHGLGKVDKTTLREVLRALNRPYTETEIGNIAGEEFDYYATANFANSRVLNRQTVLAAFQGLAGPGVVTVNADLLKFWLTTMGEELTDEELDAVLTALEIGPGGVFSVEAFLDLLEGQYRRLHERVEES